MSCIGNGEVVTLEVTKVIGGKTVRRLVDVDLDCDEDWGDLATYEGRNGGRATAELGNDVDGYWKVVRAFGEDPEGGRHEGRFPMLVEIPLADLHLKCDSRTAAYSG